MKKHKTGNFPPDFSMMSFDADFFRSVVGWIQSIEEEAINGKGLVILKGFPVEKYSPRERDLLYWLLGCCFGSPSQQNETGDLLGRVEDKCGQQRDTRGYKTARELELHRDRGGLVMLLCVRQAREGGLSYFASAYTVYNELLKMDPSMVEALTQGFRYYILGSSQSGLKAVTPYAIPVFSWKESVMSVSYIRTFIERGAENSGKPLTQKQQLAVNQFYELMNSEAIRFSICLEPGDLVICNNNIIMHGRSEFANVNLDNRSSRLLLRLWLLANKKWPLVYSMERRCHQHDFSNN